MRFNNGAEELTNYLNNLPEWEQDNSHLFTSNKTEDLNWSDFQEELGLSDRSIRLFMRKLKLIITKGKGHQINCYYEFLKYDIILQPSPIKLSIVFYMVKWIL